MEPMEASSYESPEVFDRFVFVVVGVKAFPSIHINGEFGAVSPWIGRFLFWLLWFFRSLFLLGFFLFRFGLCFLLLGGLFLQ